MKRLLILVAVLTLALAACGGSDSDTTDAGSDATTTSTAADVTTTTTASSDATALADTTTTTATAPTARARFAIVEVGLGSLGGVFIQNVGNAPGSLGGHWLCQRPLYYELPDVELQPGETGQVFVAGRDTDVFGPRSDATFVEGIAEIGEFDPADGEVGLYLSNNFGDAGAIVSYVEWGSSGHGRSDTAIDAGVWADGFVATTADSGAILATRTPPTDPGHWFAG